MITVIKVNTDSTTETLQIEPKLDNFQALLDGGWLEGIYGPGWMAYLDEEGKFKGLPVNVAATKLATAAGWRGAGYDVLCGPVLFLGPGDANGEDTSVTEAITRLLPKVES